MTIDAVAMRLVLNPLTFIQISISMNESPLTVCFVIVPPALVNRTIRPNLFSLALLNVSTNNPLTLVAGMIYLLNQGPFFKLVYLLWNLSLVEVELTLFHPDFSDLRVVVVLIH
jgi:hypothetical protein